MLLATSPLLRRCIKASWFNLVTISIYFAVKFFKWSNFLPFSSSADCRFLDGSLKRFALNRFTFRNNCSDEQLLPIVEELSRQITWQGLTLNCKFMLNSEQKDYYGLSPVLIKAHETSKVYKYLYFVYSLIHSKSASMDK